MTRRAAARALAPAAPAAAAPAAALDGLLQRAAGGELGHRRRRDRHLLARVARIDALPLLAELGRELPEAGEVDLSASLEDVGDRLEHGVDRVACFPSRDVALRRHSIHELLLRHVRSSLPGFPFKTAPEPNRCTHSAQPCGFAAGLRGS